MKQNVNKLLKDQKKKEAENYLMDTLMKKIEKNSKIVVPQTVINDEVEKQVSRIEEQAKQYNVPVDILLQYSGFESMDAYRQAGEVYIKRQIVEEIIKKENFEVAQEEIDNEYAKLANVQESDSEEEAAKKLADVKAKYATSQVEHHIMMVKALDLIKNSAVSTK